MLMTLLQAPHPAHAVYNAPCESVVVADLKHQVEAVNGKINIKLGEAFGAGTHDFSTPADSSKNSLSRWPRSLNA